MRRFAFIAAVLVGASVLAACQSQGVAYPTPQQCIPKGNCGVTIKKFPIVAAFHLKGNSAKGKTVFLTYCGGCHVLADAATVGTVGPNLDTFTPTIDYRAATAQVTNGGAQMPPQSQLSTQQIADVAAYVVTAIGGTAP